MSCDKQRVAVRILFAPVIILRVGTEAAQAVFFEKAMLQSLGEAGSTYFTRGTTLCRQNKICRYTFISVSRDTVSRHIFVVCLSRHIVVAPLPAAPLLSDTRWSTVGPGTREDTTTESDEYMTRFTFAAFSMLYMYVAIQIVILTANDIMNVLKSSSTAAAYRAPATTSTASAAVVTQFLQRLSSLLQRIPCPTQLQLPRATSLLRCLLRPACSTCPACVWRSRQCCLTLLRETRSHLDGAQDCALEHAALLREALSESA